MLGRMSVDSGLLVSARHRVFNSKALMHDIVKLVTSGEGGLPVLGSDKTEGNIMQAGVKVVFEKLLPTTAEQLQLLIKGLKAIGMTLQEYLPAAKLQELHADHGLEIPGLDEAAILQLVRTAGSAVSE